MNTACMFMVWPIYTGIVRPISDIFRKPKAIEDHKLPIAVGTYHQLAALIRESCGK